MKRIILFTATLCVFSTVFSQIGKNGKTRGRFLGVHFFFQDFASGFDLQNGAKVKDVLDNKLWNKPSALTYGFALSYTKGITPKIDLRGTLSSSFEDYRFRNRLRPGFNEYLGEIDIAGNFKAVTDNNWVIPYLTAGIGASYYRGYIGAIAPVGVGLQVNLFNDAFVDLQSQMRLGLTAFTTNHLYHSLGVKGIINKEKKATPPLVVTPPVVVKKDTDGDGINDDDDNCPDKAGVAKYNGCPVPDSDGDGVNDDNDNCVSVPGTAKYKGCPVPDTDGDGVNDDDDQCKTVAGTVANRGCPEVKEAVQKTIDYVAKNILFESNSAKLKSSSNAGLNEVVKLLNDDQDIIVSIDGHTDNTGTPERNNTLSQERADAVKAYLVKKGISESRITSTGHGQDEPVADNETTAGKAKNRRVELKLSY